MGFLQTHQPEHPVMRALIAQDREAFYAAEIEMREKTGYPPFGRLASLLVSGADKHATEALRAQARRGRADRREVRVLGPAEAPLAVVRGRHRFRLLVKSPRNYDLSAYLREWLASAQNEEDAQARGRCRPAELFLKFIRVPARSAIAYHRPWLGFIRRGRSPPGHRRQGGHSMPVFSRIAALAFVGLSSLFRPPTW